MKTTLLILSVLFSVEFGCTAQEGSVSDKSTVRLHEFFKICRLPAPGNFDSVIIYDCKVNRKGKILDSIQVAISSITQVQESEIYEYTYDSANRESLRFEIKDGLRLLNDEKQYDSAGRINLWIWYTRAGQIHSRTFYHYDRQGNLILKERYAGYWYKEMPYLEERIENTYQDDRITETRVSHNRGTDSTWYMVEKSNFDSLGRKVSYQYESEDWYWLTTSVYNEAGQLSEEVIEGKGRERSKKVISYYPNGLPQQLHWYYPERKNNCEIRLTKYHYKPKI